MTKRHFTAEQMQAASEIGDGGKRTICPKCGHPRFYASNSRPGKDGVRRRNRVCFACGYVIEEKVLDPIVELE
jgi:RNase P subunit RPR2